MAVYFVTGKLGSGKTLISVAKMADKLRSGCPVASNIDIRLHRIPNLSRFDRLSRFHRLPDKPTLDDFLSIGVGNTTYDENRNGLIVLDECGTWFNTRTWSDKSRQPVIDWLLHARKLGWDIIFLVQDLNIVDKQARLSLAEHVVYCRRIDRLRIPFLGSLYSLFMGSKMPLPKVHLAIVKYGDSPTSPVVDRWIYTGTPYYDAYDTKQVFSSNYEHGPFTALPPFFTHGQFIKPLGVSSYMRLTRIYLKKFSRIVAFSLGFALSWWLYSPSTTNTSSQPAYDISSFRINSISLFGSDVTYTFSYKGDLVKSTDLVDSGFSFKYIDNCSVRVSYSGVSTIVKC